MKNTFKRIFALTLILTILVASLSSCAITSSSTTKLYVYNWGEYISDGSEGSYDTNKLRRNRNG